MTACLLLTGKPGSGKTTLVRRALQHWTQPAYGFYTTEIRQAGVRQGFRLVALDGHTTSLAHVNFPKVHSIGKYGVDLTGLENLAVPALYQAIDQRALAVIDEIGPMEILSPAFCKAVEAVLDSSTSLLGTIVQRSTPFTDRVKRHPGIHLLEITPANRDGLLEQILATLQSG